MAYRLLPELVFQLEDANGNPAVGHTITSYLYNTTTPSPLYSDSSGTALPNPFTLNSRGQPQTAGNAACMVYADTTVTTGYKLVQKDADGATVKTYEGPIYPVVSQATLDALTASDVGFTDPFSSIDRNVETIILSFMTPLLWFIPDTYHADIAAGTSTINLATYFANAMSSSAKGLYAEAGTYQIAASIALGGGNKRFYGEGMDITIFRMPQSNQTLNYNMFDGGSNDLSNFMLQDITLKGSLDYQTSAATSSLVGFALYSRGAVNNVHFVRTKITKFGDQVNYSGGGGGGGIVLGHPTTSATSGKASANISALFCVFDTNGNVPGFYLSQGGDGDTSNVKIIGNHFTGGGSSGSAQNCLYLLGQDATRLITDFVIQGNTFKLSTAFDQAIELNWVRHGVCSGNTCHITSAVASATSGFILLRDGCEDIVVSGNTGRDDSGLSVSGVSLVRFGADAYHTGTDQQRWITIDGNTMHGFDRGIDIGSGSQYVGVTDNVLASCGAGLYLTGCSDTEVSHNKVYNCGYAGVISGGTATIRRLKINHNESYSGTSGAWTNLVANEDIQYLEFENNTDAGSAGTYMLDMNTAVATGNRFVENRSSLTPLNPSHLGDFATIKLADTGQITIADGTTGPNVRSGTEFVCAATAGTVISSLVGTGYVGQTVTIRLKANWTVDFTGTTLKGNGGVDLAGTASNGIRCQWDGTNWLCDVLGA